jgi:hypothetical protein
MHDEAQKKHTFKQGKEDLLFAGLVVFHFKWGRLAEQFGT